MPPVDPSLYQTISQTMHFLRPGGTLRAETIEGFDPAIGTLVQVDLTDITGATTSYMKGSIPVDFYMRWYTRSTVFSGEITVTYTYIPSAVQAPDNPAVDRGPVVAPAVPANPFTPSPASAPPVPEPAPVRPPIARPEPKPLYRPKPPGRRGT